MRHERLLLWLLWLLLLLLLLLVCTQVTIDVTLEMVSAVNAIRFDWWNICAAFDIKVLASASADGDDFEEKVTSADAIRNAEMGKKSDYTILLGWESECRRIRVVLGGRQTLDHFYYNFGIRRLKIFARTSKVPNRAVGSGGPGRRAMDGLLLDAATRLAKENVDSEIESVAADAGDTVPSDVGVLDCAIAHITELATKHLAAADKGKGGWVMEEEYDDDDGTMGEGGGEWPPPV